MKQVIFAFLLIGGLAHAGEVKMSVTGPNGMSGTATVVNKLLEDGSKYVRLSMDLTNPTGPGVSVLQESTYDKRGMPIRKLQTTSVAGSKTKQSTIALFGEDGVNLTFDDGEKASSKKLPLPTGKSVLVKTEFWFVRDQPAPGGVNTYNAFDLVKREWVETKAVYMGKRSITIAGRVQKAFLVTHGAAKAYVDEKGDPYRLEFGQIVMERL